ncbi:MAG: hypothetical protein ACRD5L_04270 [Bryobacteraceae bacterium]
MRRLSSIALLAGLLLPALAGCGMSDAVDSAKNSVNTFHFMLNDAKYDAIYDASDPLLQKAADRAALRKVFSKIRERMGSCSDPTDWGYLYNVTTQGRFVKLTDKASCTNGPISEEFQWRISGKQCLLVSYHAESPLLGDD